MRRFVGHHSGRLVGDLVFFVGLSRPSIKRGVMPCDAEGPHPLRVESPAEDVVPLVSGVEILGREAEHGVGVAGRFATL